jgi:hypothetical protein
VDSLLTPPILFFALGVFAAVAGSDLEVPQPIAKFLSLYLLLAIGMHGGHALHESGFTWGIVAALVAAMLMATVVPFVAFFVLRARLGLDDAAAVAATYGSVSAVTFVTAGTFLTSAGIPWGGHMVAAMALMESPAIVVGVLLHRWAGGTTGERLDLRELLRETAFNGSVVLILGSLLIGLVTGSGGWAALSPFADGIFKGMLSFFLLDLGLLAARRWGDLRSAGAFLPAFAVLTPVGSAAVAIVLARAIGLGAGDAIMFAVLCASASYIAVPAALRLAIPRANPSVYVSMALALTFPFNILVGIPLYTFVVRAWWG